MTNSIHKLTDPVERQNPPKTSKPSRVMKIADKIISGLAYAFFSNFCLIKKAVCVIQDASKSLYYTASNYFNYPSTMTPSLEQGIKLLSENNLLTEENKAHLLSHMHPLDLASGFVILKQCGHLKKDNKAILIKDAFPSKRAFAIVVDSPDFNDDHVAYLSEKDKKLFEILELLKSTNTFTQDTTSSIFECHEEKIHRAICILNQDGSLNADNLAFILIKPYRLPDERAYALINLSKAGLLNDKTKALISSSWQPHLLAHCLAVLTSAGICNERNTTLVQASGNLLLLTGSLMALQKASILDQHVFDLIYNHQDPRSLASSFCALKQLGVLNHEYAELVARYRNPRETIPLAPARIVWGIPQGETLYDPLQGSPAPLIFTISLCSLQHVGILNQENARLVSLSHDPTNFTSALIRLNMNAILNQESITFISHFTNAQYLKFPSGSCLMYRSPFHLAISLEILHKASLATEFNKQLLHNSMAPIELAKCLCLFHEAGILNEANHPLMIEKTESYMKAIFALEKAKIFTLTNLLMLFEESPDTAPHHSLNLCLESLQKVGGLDQDTFELMIRLNPEQRLELIARKRAMFRRRKHALLAFQRTQRSA